MLKIDTIYPKFRNRNHDDLYLRIKRRLNYGEHVNAIASDFGIVPSTLSNILARNGTSIDEERNTRIAKVRNN